MEAEVFKQQRLALLEFERHFFGFGPNALGAEANIFAARQFLVEQHAEALGDGFQTQLWIRLAFGTAQVRREDEARAVTQSVFDGGQGFADAGVVHDAAVVERDVEVDAHEDAPIVERKIANRKFGHGKHSVIRRWFSVVGRSSLVIQVRRYQNLQSFGRHQVDQIADTARVSPLVVIPGDHLDAVAADD